MTGSELWHFNAITDATGGKAVSETVILKRTSLLLKYLSEAALTIGKKRRNI